MCLLIMNITFTCVPFKFTSIVAQDISCTRAHLVQVEAFTFYNFAKERCQQIKNEFRNRKSKGKKECD